MNAREIGVLLDKLSLMKQRIRELRTSAGTETEVAKASTALVKSFFVYMWAAEVEPNCRAQFGSTRLVR